jgi:MscS family membrane protein
LIVLSAIGQDSFPLQPPDQSTPRAALRTFLAQGDAFGVFLARDYIQSPTRAGYRHVVFLGEQLTHGLDLSQLPPAARLKEGRAAALALYETLNRLPLPSLSDVSNLDTDYGQAGTNAVRWVVPNTEIVMIRATAGPRAGAFLFSPETVDRADRFFSQVRGLPYARAVPFENVQDVLASGGGWLVPYAWVRAMPAWLRSPLAGQAVWKWIASALLLAAFALLLGLVFRLSRRLTKGSPFRQAVAQEAFPLFVLLAVPALAYLLLVQINMRDHVGSAIELWSTGLIFLAGAWMAWRAAPVVAEAIIASPSIAPESIDAHLIRISTRLLGIGAGAALLAMGADRLGAPVYGIVAGLGVGGLAIALAAQPTIENLIGGLSLFADKPVRVGELCRCGSDEGTVESIGLRSTRIRGLDRTVTTIPNAELSKMAIVNLTERDRFLLQAVIGLRYETSPEQVRVLLGQIRELLAGHPLIQTGTSRARFIGFGPSSLDIEVVAYVMTRDKTVFLGVREEVWLSVMDSVERSGTGFAFPSQTLYIARDKGLSNK